MSANPRSPESGATYEAYYFELAATGVTAIDRVLSAVASAGRAYHHTEDWSTADRNAPSAADEIQSAANEGARSIRAEIASLTAELSAARERADRAEQDSKRLDYLAQWGFVRAGSAWCPDAEEMVGHFEWVQPGCWATLMPMQGRDDAWEQDQYVECDIPLRDAVDAAMKASTPTPTPDHA